MLGVLNHGPLVSFSDVPCGTNELKDNETVSLDMDFITSVNGAFIQLEEVPFIEMVVDKGHCFFPNLV